MIGQRYIELLSPAKNAEIGIGAINHGADAVYIGAPRFGARSAAGNSIGDIERLSRYAHLFGAKVYVALNTILRDEELEEARRIVYDLYHAGADALIVQDMGLLQLDLPPIPLHASTQTDNRTPEKVKFLEAVGFSQVVLARELSIDKIREIHDVTDVPLEFFIHGALCVSYSGQCYLSHALSGRSANRGECAQYCRLPYTLTDASGRVWAKDRHLLSLKDLNLSDRLEQLLDAGVSSLKIEGRLKDISYVKNITAYYRRKLDEIFSRRFEYQPSSVGCVALNFDPNPAKSFNRGFTRYYVDGRTPDPVFPDTPKSIGEPVGIVKSILGNSIVVSGTASFSNGDGFCFRNDKGIFEGFRINRAEGNRIFPSEMPCIHPKTVLYRNYDQAFEKILSRKSAERTIRVDIRLYKIPFGLALEMTDETGLSAVVTRECVLEPARTPQEENQCKQLSKLGDTVFRAENIVIETGIPIFIPSSLLADMRRDVTEKLISVRLLSHRSEKRRKRKKNVVFGQESLTYLGNVANCEAVSFYKQYGVKNVEPAYEIMAVKDVPLMFTRYCIKHMMGWCPKQGKKGELPVEPLRLSYKEIDLRLEFDCKNCGMRVYKASDF